MYKHFYPSAVSSQISVIWNVLNIGLVAQIIEVYGYKSSKHTDSSCDNSDNGNYNSDYKINI